jgi:hypothetical protein
MKSYELIGTHLKPQSIEQISQVVSRLSLLGLVIINVQTGRTPSVHVQPTPATQRLESVCTGQGWADGKMYKSYAAVIDGVKVYWHKPMRAPEASKVIRWLGQGYRRAAR